MISKCPEVMEKYTEQSTCVSPNQKPIIIKEKPILMCDSIWKKQNKKHTPATQLYYSDLSPGCNYQQ